MAFCVNRACDLRRMPWTNHACCATLFAYEKAQGNFKLLKKLIHQIFIDKYYHDKNFYNSKVIEDIINNESTHVVAEFKDYLIYGDDSEFLQKNYSIKDSRKYLPKIFNYYESCSVIFPNYVILPESKYIYKNIQKKQKVIDLQQEQEDKLEKLKYEENNEKDLGGGKNSIYKLFNTKEINSILGQTNTSNINKIFGINYNNKNENEKSESMFNNIIKEFKKVEDKKSFQKKNINLIKKKCRIPSLNLNNTKGLMKQFNIQSLEKEKEKENNDQEKYKKNYKKKTYIIINKQNNNLKHFHIKKKSISKKNENNKSNLILNNSKKIKNHQRSKKENKTFLTNENNCQKIVIGVGLDFFLMKVSRDFTHLNKMEFNKDYHESDKNLIFLDYETIIQLFNKENKEQKENVLSQLKLLSSQDKNKTYIISDCKKILLDEVFGGIPI